MFKWQQNLDMDKERQQSGEMSKKRNEHRKEPEWREADYSDEQTNVLVYCSFVFLL